MAQVKKRSSTLSTFTHGNPMMNLSLMIGAIGATLGAAPPPARVVTVKATDFRFEAPSAIPAGTITFRLQNLGKEIHHLWIVQLTEGKTAAEFQTVMKAWGSALKMPSWAIDVGGPNSAAAGETAEGTMTLDPGTYMLVCWVPSPDGMLHVMKGMVRPLTVTSRDATKLDEPAPDATMTLDDYSFALSKPIAAGRRILRFENRATQSHEAVIARLAPGATLLQAVLWMDGGQLGTAPVVPLGGGAGLAKGRHMFVTIDFTPGTYVLLCFIPDVKDGKPHSDHGMMKEIIVE